MIVFRMIVFGIIVFGMISFLDGLTTLKFLRWVFINFSKDFMNQIFCVFF